MVEAASPWEVGLNTEFEAWLQEGNDSCTIITVEGDDEHIIFEIDEFEYRLHVTSSGQMKLEAVK